MGGEVPLFFFFRATVRFRNKFHAFCCQRLQLHPCTGTQLLFTRIEEASIKGTARSLYLSVPEAFRECSVGVHLYVRMSLCCV